MIKNNFTLYTHDIFHADLLALITKVKKIKIKVKRKHGKNYKDIEEYKSNEDVKKLTLIRQFIKEEVPMDCNHNRYYGTPPLEKCFRRVKWNERYRLFFQHDIVNKEIVYLWFNNEGTLRSRNSRTDCYNVFENMVKSGYVDTTFSNNKHHEYQEPLVEFLN